MGWYQVTQRGGMRCSAAVGYLHPVLGRENLTLITGAHVNRLLLDGHRATGVEIDRDGDVSEITAEREVILSAGAYQSPQILLLSGVGPADDLALVGIPCAHELPVGQGLQDHPSTWITYTTNEASLLSAESEENLGLLTTEGRGPLTSNFAESGGFFRTDDGLEAPDIQLHQIPILFPEAGAGEILVDGWALSACLLRPDEHRLRQAALPRPHRQAADPAQLPRHQRGQGGADQGGPPRGGHRLPAGAGRA